MTLLILFALLALFLAGAHGLRLRFRSALAESTAIGVQMDRHGRAVREALCVPDHDMAIFELTLLDGVWNRIVERSERLQRWYRRWV